MPNAKPTQTNAGPRRPVLRGALVLFGFFATAGMLIWGKLRLVEDIPRTAWAVPSDDEAPARADADETPGVDASDD